VPCVSPVGNVPVERNTTAAPVAGAAATVITVGEATLIVAVCDEPKNAELATIKLPSNTGEPVAIKDPPTVKSPTTVFSCSTTFTPVQRNKTEAPAGTGTPVPAAVVLPDTVLAYTVAV